MSARSLRSGSGETTGAQLPLRDSGTGGDLVGLSGLTVPAVLPGRADEQRGLDKDIAPVLGPLAPLRVLPRRAHLNVGPKYKLIGFGAINSTLSFGPPEDGDIQHLWDVADRPANISARFQTPYGPLPPDPDAPKPPEGFVFARCADKFDVCEGNEFLGGRYLRYKWSSDRREELRAQIMRTVEPAAFTPMADPAAGYSEELRVPGQIQATPGWPIVVQAAEPGMEEYQQVVVAVHDASTLEALFPGVRADMVDLGRALLGDPSSDNDDDRKPFYMFEYDHNERDRQAYLTRERSSRYEGSYSMGATVSEGTGLGCIQPAQQPDDPIARARQTRILRSWARVAAKGLKASLNYETYRPLRERNIHNNLVAFGDEENVFFSSLQINVSFIRVAAEVVNLADSLGFDVGHFHVDGKDGLIDYTVLGVMVKAVKGTDPGCFSFPESGIFVHCLSVLDELCTEDTVVYFVTITFRGKKIHGGTGPRTLPGVELPAGWEFYGERVACVAYVSEAVASRLGTVALSFPNGFGTSAQHEVRKLAQRTFLEVGPSLFGSRRAFIRWFSREIAFATHNEWQNAEISWGSDFWIGPQFSVLDLIKTLCYRDEDGQIQHAPTDEVIDPVASRDEYLAMGRRIGRLYQHAAHFHLPVNRVALRKFRSGTKKPLRLPPPSVSAVTPDQLPLILAVHDVAKDVTRAQDAIMRHGLLFCVEIAANDDKSENTLRWIRDYDWPESDLKATLVRQTMREFSLKGDLDKVAIDLKPAGPTPPNTGPHAATRSTKKKRPIVVDDSSDNGSEGDASTRAGKRPRISSDPDESDGSSEDDGFESEEPTIAGQGSKKGKGVERKDQTGTKSGQESNPGTGTGRKSKRTRISGCDVEKVHVALGRLEYSNTLTTLIQRRRSLSTVPNSNASFSGLLFSLQSIEQSSALVGKLNDPVVQALACFELARTCSSSFADTAAAMHAADMLSLHTRLSLCRATVHLKDWLLLHGPRLAHEIFVPVLANAEPKRLELDGLDWLDRLVSELFRIGTAARAVSTEKLKGRPKPKPQPGAEGSVDVPDSDSLYMPQMEGGKFTAVAQVPAKAKSSSSATRFKKLHVRVRPLNNCDVEVFYQELCSLLVEALWDSLILPGLRNVALYGLDRVKPGSRASQSKRIASTIIARGVVFDCLKSASGGSEGIWMLPGVYNGMWANGPYDWFPGWKDCDSLADPLRTSYRKAVRMKSPPKLTDAVQHLRDTVSSFFDVHESAVEDLTALTECFEWHSSELRSGKLHDEGMPEAFLQQETERGPDGAANEHKSSKRKAPAQDRSRTKRAKPTTSTAVEPKVSAEQLPRPSSTAFLVPAMMISMSLLRARDRRKAATSTHAPSASMDGGSSRAARPDWMREEDVMPGRYLRGEHPRKETAAPFFNTDQIDPVPKFHWSRGTLDHYLSKEYLMSDAGLPFLLSCFGTGQGVETRDFLIHWLSSLPRTKEEMFALYRRWVHSNSVAETFVRPDAGEVGARWKDEQPGYSKVHNMKVYNTAARAISFGEDGEAINGWWSDDVTSWWKDVVKKLPTTKLTWSRMHAEIIQLQKAPFKSASVCTMQLCHALAAHGFCHGATLEEMGQWIAQHRNLGAYRGLARLGFGELATEDAIVLAFRMVAGHVRDNLTQDEQEEIGFDAAFLENLLCKFSRAKSTFESMHLDVTMEDWAVTWFNIPRPLAKLAVWDAARRIADCSGGLA